MSTFAPAAVHVLVWVVGLRAVHVLVCRSRPVEQAGAHVHPQRPETAAGGCVGGSLSAPVPLLPFPPQLLLGAPHLEGALLHLHAQVQSHLGEARAVRVSAPYTPQRRRPSVQVAVLQQELALGLRPGDQLMFVLVVPDHTTHVNIADLLEG